MMISLKTFDQYSNRIGLGTFRVDKILIAALLRSIDGATMSIRWQAEDRPARRLTVGRGAPAGCGPCRQSASGIAPQGALLAC
jgi:hypothetical protein